MGALLGSYELPVYSLLTPSNAFNGEWKSIKNKSGAIESIIIQFIVDDYK